MTQNADREHKQTLLGILKRRLRKLELKAAAYGIDCPAETLMEIEKLVEDIATLEFELGTDNEEIFSGLSCPVCKKNPLKEIGREVFTDDVALGTFKRQTEIIIYKCVSCNASSNLNVPFGEPSYIERNIRLDITDRGAVVGMAAVGVALGVGVVKLASIISGDDEEALKDDSVGDHGIWGNNETFANENGLDDGSNVNADSEATEMADQGTDTDTEGTDVSIELGESIGSDDYDLEDLDF